jgi:ectoine hydroxylase-related dioxygenase (phytanoyl-CoA dioxygenase family)
MKEYISREQVEQYENNGFVVLRNVIPSSMIEKIQQECDRFLKEKDAEMDAKGVTADGGSFKGKRYFIAMRNKDSQPMQELLYGKELEQITRRILGENVFLFLEQFVVKSADKGMTFAWHQDSGYLPFPHKPYLSCWLPLDDVTEENGTVYLLSYDIAGTRVRVEHRPDKETNDEVGYFGDNPGVPVILKKGDVALFSSVCFHRSGSNNTDKPRRVLLMQYSPEPILKEGKPFRLMEPFIVHGELMK